MMRPLADGSLGSRPVVNDPRNGKVAGLGGSSGTAHVLAQHGSGLGPWDERGSRVFSFED